MTTNVIFPGNLGAVENISQLRAVNGDNLTAKALIVTQGQIVYGDGNGAIYTYDPASVAADDGYYVIQPTSITGAGRWVSVVTGVTPSSSTPTATIKGRITAGTGAVENLTPTQAKSVIGISNVENKSSATIRAETGTPVNGTTASFGDIYAFGAGLGYVRAQVGTATETGIFSFMNAAGAIQAYMGNAGTNAAIQMASLTTGGWIFSAGGSNRVLINGTGLGFNGSTAIAKPAITGSRGGNAALASLLTQLANYGLITDSTTA